MSYQPFAIHIILYILHVLFNLFFCLDLSESGEMCTMKEVTLFSDDAKSKESAQQLGQVTFFFLVLFGGLRFLVVCPLLRTFEEDFIVIENVCRKLCF